MTTITQPLTLGNGQTLGKYHGIGNDFVVLLDAVPGSGDSVAVPGSGDSVAVPGSGDSVAVPGSGGAELARRVCDRHRGVGADGLILGGRAPEGSGALLTFALWNADGSTAEMSGNGMRCLAHAALDAGWVPAGEPFGVLTPAGRKQVTIRRTGPAATWASVEMGVAGIDGDDQRCNIGHGQLHVDMGNPHLVVLGPDPATVDVATLGPALEHSVASGLNVEFVTLGPGPDEVTMRVWERGVGETQACGTGSCAAAVAFHYWGRVGSQVTVHQPGGAVAVEIGPQLSVTLAGPSERIAGLVL